MPWQQCFLGDTKAQPRGGMSPPLPDSMGNASAAGVKGWNYSDTQVLNASKHYGYHAQAHQVTFMAQLRHLNGGMKVWGYKL